MPPRVYIDGHVGTTRLRIRDWLAGRLDLELVALGEERRKDESARRDCLRGSDVAILCLPDEAARAAAAWVEGMAAGVVCVTRATQRFAK